MWRFAFFEKIKFKIENMEVVANANAINSAEEFSADLLRVYYSRLFPYNLMFNWFAYGNDSDKKVFPHREWSFTAAGDIYMRYQSFNNENEFREAIQKRQPEKIDIGGAIALILYLVLSLTYSHTHSQRYLLIHQNFMIM